MSGTRIEDYRNDVRDFIQNSHADWNNDGIINDSNGELSSLLSNMNAESEDELYSTGKLRNKYMWGIAGTTCLGLAGLKIGHYYTKGEGYQKAVKCYDSQLKKMRQIIADYDCCKINKPAEEVAETLRKLYKKPFLVKSHNKLTLATQFVGEAALVISALLGVKAAFTSESK